MRNLRTLGQDGKMYVYENGCCSGLYQIWYIKEGANASLLIKKLWRLVVSRLSE